MTRGKILRCWIVGKKRWVALINLKVERARRRASLADRFLRGVTQFLDVLALRAVSFRKIHEPDEPSRQYPLWVMTPGPRHRNAGARKRRRAPFIGRFIGFEATRPFSPSSSASPPPRGRLNVKTNDGDEPPPPSSSAFCLHIVKHICLILRAVVNLCVCWRFPPFSSRI